MIGFFVFWLFFAETGVYYPFEASLSLHAATFLIGVGLLGMITLPPGYNEKDEKQKVPTLFRRILDRLGMWTISFILFGFLTVFYLGFRVIFPKKPKNPPTA